MKKTKKEFKYYTIFQYEEEQKYLSEMHAHGWKFTHISGIGMYHFEECEPEEVVYQLDYNQEGRKNKEEYVGMFEDCGWEYMFDFAQYSYFRKPKAEMNGEEEIFCDEQSRYEMMNRVYKGRLVPLLVLFCALLVPQFLLNTLVYKNYGVATMYGVILGLYIAIFVLFLQKREEFKKNMEL